LKLVSFPEAGNTGTTVVSTDFSPDGTRLISVSSDGEVWLWDAGSGKALIQLRESRGPYEVREVTVVAKKYGPLTDKKRVSIAFSPDGQKITLTTVSPDAKGDVVRIETWDGSPRQK
jgi:Tol biopolymer transport system component